MVKIKDLRIRDFLVLTLAGMINAFGITMFLSPLNLYDSGVSGTSMLLAQLTPPQMSLSIFLLILNIPLFLYGFKKQGAVFTVYAVYTVMIYSLFAWLFTSLIPIMPGGGSPFAGRDLLLCSIFGGIISGIGSGLAIRGGGAMDGIEVMAVIFARRIGISVGSFVMVYNVILYILCGIMLRSWSLPLYSVITYAAGLKTIDFIVEGFDREKCAMIVAEKPDLICKVLADEFGSGMTRVEARGGYSGVEKTIIYFVVNRFQITKMKSIVHSIDPAAYITISEVADVFKATQ